MEAREIKRPWLGVGGAAVTRQLRETRGLPDGVYVTRVYPDSPAALAGLEPFQSLRGIGRGDVITAVDGNEVTSMDDMVGYFNTLRPGDVVTLSVYRGSQTVEVDVQLAPWPD